MICEEDLVEELTCNVVAAVVAELVTEHVLSVQPISPALALDVALVMLLLTLVPRLTPAEELTVAPVTALPVADELFWTAVVPAIELSPALPSRPGKEVTMGPVTGPSCVVDRFADGMGEVVKAAKVSVNCAP